MNHLKPKVIAVWLQPDHPFCDDFLHNLPLPESCHILGVVRQTDVFLTHEDPIIQAGDLIISVATNPMFAPALLACLKEHLMLDSWLETHSVHWPYLR